MVLSKNAVDALISSVSQINVRYPRRVLIVAFFLFGLLASNLFNLKFDTTLEGYLSETAPELAVYKEFREQFGQDVSFIVLADADDLFSVKTVEALLSLSHVLETKIAGIARVSSLYNSTWLVGDEDEISAIEFVETKKINPEYLAERKKWLEQNDSFLNKWIKGNKAILMITLQNSFTFDEDDARAVNQSLADQETIRRIGNETIKKLAEFESKALKLSLGGAPIIFTQLEESLINDLGVFIFLVSLLLMSSMYLMFRRAWGVVLPLTIVYLAVISTMSMMAMFGKPIQIPTGIIPSFLLAVGIADAVHYLNIFFNQYIGSNDKAESVKKALEQTAMPMFLTSVTTAMGLISFSFSELTPIANLGVFSAVGVMIAFVLSVTVLPALLMVLPIKSASEVKRVSQGESAIFKGVTRVAVFLAKNYASKVVALSVIVLIGSSYFASRLEFTLNPLNWMPPNHEVHQTTNTLDTAFGGSVPIELIIDTNQLRGVLAPGVLSGVEDANMAVMALKNNALRVGQVNSVLDLVKEANRAVNNGDDYSYSISSDTDLIAQNLLLVEVAAAKSLYEYVDPQLKVMRVTIVVPWVDTKYYTEFVDEITSIYRTRLPKSVSVSSTGIVPLLSASWDQLHQTTAQSYLIAVLVVSALMVLGVGNLFLGVAIMLPNLVPITFVLGVLAASGGQLDLMTLLVGSIAIGLAVDDTIHFLHTYQGLVNRGVEMYDAISETIATTGRAMAITTLSITSGFIVLLTSDMLIMFNFGLMTSAVIMLALLFDFFVLPSVIVFCHHRSKRLLIAQDFTSVG